MSFVHAPDYDKIQQGDIIIIDDLHEAIKSGKEITAKIKDENLTFQLKHDLSPRQIDVLFAGGLINWAKK